MDSTLKKRIHKELLKYLNREPSEDEIINAQNDHIIMMKVNSQINQEEKMGLQNQITDLKGQLLEVKVSVDSVTNSVDSTITKTVG